MTKKTEIALFIVLALVWGTSFTAIEVGLETLPPIYFAALRFDIAAVLFASVVAVGGYAWIPRTRADLALVASTGTLVIAAHYAFLFLGQTYVTSSVAAIVLSFTPIVTPAIALYVLPRQRIRLTDVLGLSFGVVGVATIAASTGTFDGNALGFAFLLLSAVAFAFGSVLTQRWRSTLPVVSLQAWSMLVGAALLHVTSYLHPAETATRVTWTVDAVGALIYLSVATTALGFFIYFTLLDRVGVTNVTLINYASPVVATLFGGVVLGESITVTTLVGFAAIVAGFALCKIRSLWQAAQSVRRSRNATFDVGPEETVIRGKRYYTTEISNTDRDVVYRSGD